MKLKINISPCPNDTFMFEAMLHGRIDTEGLEFETSFADIEQLNALVAESKTDICKISYAILPQITDDYALLNSGSALGRGNGPLLVCRDDIDALTPALRVAIPGEHTTANMLMKKILPQVTDKPCYLFSEIAQAVSRGECDAGVLIHEGRFTYRERGLKLLYDLGHKWEETSGLPLPLGAIVISRELPIEIQRRVERVLERSIRYAFEHPEVSAEFVGEHAQELSTEVTRQHIEMFVNQYSLCLGSEGERAVRELTGLEGDIFIANE